MRMVQTRHGAVDVSGLTAGDVANLALQRTDTLFNTRIRKIGAPSYLFWARFKTALPLQLEARLRRRYIVRRALAAIVEDVDQIIANLGSLSVGSLCDIGCGYAFHDVLFSRLMDIEHVHLIDIEQTRERAHDFGPTGSGYSNLARAAAMVERNAPSGQKPKVTCVNPLREAMGMESRYDLIMSLLSCGFHYPVETYVPFFERCLTPGGRIVLDLRGGYDHSAIFASFQVESTITATGKSTRVLLARK